MNLQAYIWKQRKGYDKMTSNKLFEYIGEKTKDDGIYEIYCRWAGEKSSHVFCIEKDNGVLKYFDPQTGSSNVAHYLGSMDYNLVGIIRIDDKLVNPKIGEIFTKSRS